MKYVHYKWLDYMMGWYEEGTTVYDDMTIPSIILMLEGKHITKRMRQRNGEGPYSEVKEPAKVIIINIIKE